MNIEVLNVIPIIIPEKLFIDRCNLYCGFCTNNLALHINHDGFITMLIRQVNYRRFGNQHCIVGSDKSISEYGLLVGKDLEHLEYYDIIYDWNYFPYRGTTWLGMEDIRFIDQTRLLITCPERNINGLPCIFYGILDGNIITLKEKLEPSYLEKNWLPYNDTKVIYHVDPFTIKSIFNDDRQVIDIGEEQLKLKGYHGSTNAVPFKGELLFLTHLYTNRTLHRWVLFNPDTNSVKVSEPFSYFKYSYIEINSSLQFYNNVYYVTLAVHEDKIYVVTFTPEMIPF